MYMPASVSRMYLLEKAPVRTALLKLGLPTLIGTFVSALYNVVDAFWVGQLGTAQIAAVTVVYPFTMVGMAFGMLFGSGANSSIARLLGKKQYAAARTYSSTAAITGVAVMTLLTALMLYYLDPLLYMLGATESSIGYAREYGILFIVGLVFNVFNMCMNNILVAEGNSATAMTAMLAGGAANVVLDPILIFGFDMGVAGAAVATLISRWISSAVYISYMRSGASYVAVSFRYFKPSFVLYKEVFKIGLPFCFFQLLNGLAVSLTNVAARPFGDAAIATMGIVSRIMSLESLGLFGFFKGYSPLAGYNYAAGNLDRAKSATTTAMRWGTGANIIFGVVCLLFAQPLIYLFNQESADVLALGVVALHVFGLSYMTLGFQIVINNYFLAVGKASQGMVMSVCRQGLFFIPILFLFTNTWGVMGLIYSQLASDICSTALGAALWLHELRAYKQQQPAAV